MMKRFFLFAVILSVASAGMLAAQDVGADAVPDVPAIVIDADNPGMAWLDQATEAKLRASTVLDLGQVILLCQRAKRTGLSGENLRYCNQLLASTQLQRGLFFAASLLGDAEVRPRDWQLVRRRALDDLEEAVMIIKDQPPAYLRIAQLNLLPDGNEERAKEALRLVIQSAKNEPALQFQAVRLLADLEPEPEKREAVLALAARNGEPRIVLLHALSLFDLKRNNEALNVLRTLIETESDNTALHEQIVAILTDVREYKSAMSILDALRETRTEGDQRHRIDLMRAEVFAKMEQYDEALKLLNTLARQSQENPELSMLTLVLRSATYLAMDNFDAALKDIEAAEKIRPDVLPILEQKYSILIEQEKYSAALAVVKQLQSISDRLQYKLREILLLSEQGEYDTAIEVIQKLRETYPEDEAQWILLLVETYSKQKTYDKALALLEEQLKKNPEELRWIVAKTQIFSGQKKWDEAVHWLESHLAKNPDSRELNLLLISVLADQKSLRAAKERLKTLLTKQPDDLTLLRLDSQLSISMGLHSEAIRVLTKVIEADPEDYTSINNLAWILCTSPIDAVRNGRRAVELAERAGELTKHKRAFVLSTLAAAHAEAGDFEKAREIAKKSVEIAKKERGKTEEERKELLDHLQKEWDCFSQDMPFRELLNEESP